MKRVSGLCLRISEALKGIVPYMFGIMERAARLRTPRRECPNRIGSSDLGRSMRFNLDQRGPTVYLEWHGTAVNCNPNCNPNWLVSCADAHSSPACSSRLSSTARRGSGAGPGGQGGAPCWTNDLDPLALPRSACPGSMADGMSAPTSATCRPTAMSMSLAIIPEPECPRVEAGYCLDQRDASLGDWRHG